MKQFKQLLFSLLLPLGVGMLSSYLTPNSMRLFTQLQRPPLSPPGVVFPIVWTVLYLLMGWSAWRIWQSGSPQRNEALLLYAVQLAMNFLWSIFFFGFELYLFSFLWLLLLWGVLAAMILRFWKIDPLAAVVQLPYLLWVTFAGYLNFGIYLLNQA